MNPLCMPFLFCCDQDSPDKWVSSVQSVLQDTRCRIGISDDLRQALLLEEDIDDFALFGPNLVQEDENNTTTNDATFLLKGLPQSPLYIELGNRLFFLRKHSQNPQGPQPPWLLPAAHFGLKELPEELSDILPRKATKQCIREWIHNVGTRGILRILGMRSTVGTDSSRLPPSWKRLLEAASVENRASLSVAARARAKHAHRGRDQFFGLVTGGRQQQNWETYQIILLLLREAAWINIHTFASGTTDPSLEVRVASGYGARWQLETKNVVFRGFLEPQMPNGHERHWRH